jgi:hypothetical protein
MDAVLCDMAGERTFDTARDSRHSARVRSRRAVRKRGQKNSPSRWRFRPPNLLAFRFRVRPSGSASTYSRSVLGARGNLVGRQAPCKTYQEEKDAICANFTRTTPISTSSSLLQRAGPWIHRVGGAFVHRTDGLFASAYDLSARLRPTRTPCSVHVESIPAADSPSRLRGDEKAALCGARNRREEPAVVGSNRDLT